MNKVPKMISTKDLDYVCDMINWNFVAAKKAKKYEEESNDDEIAKFFKDLHRIHKDHYDFILNQIK